MKTSGMSRSTASRSATEPSESIGGGSGKANMSAQDRILIAMVDDGGEIEYTVRRSPRARRVRVTVDPQRGVQVVLPRRAAEREAAAAIRELGPWIRRRVDEMQRAQATVAARGDTLPYLGETWQVIEQDGRRRAHRRGGELHVPAGPERVAAIERWYRRAAREEI